MIWGLVAALAASHFLYAFIWFFPNLWRAWCGKDSVAVFERTAWALKVLQGGVVVSWFVGQGGVFHPTQVQLWRWPLFFGLVGFGQSLNAGIFRAIGHTGVYYGCKLGHTIPWHDGFPFNIAPHPQYLGAILTIWGFAALVGSQAPAGLLTLSSYWTGLYVITAIQEQFL